MEQVLSVPQTLRAAVDVLNTGGWAIGHLTCTNGSCALGAIAIARGWLEPYDPDEVDFDYDSVWSKLENDPAVHAVSDSIKTDYAESARSIGKSDIPDTNRVYRWNDTFAGDKEEVVARFLAVADAYEAANSVA